MVDAIAKQARQTALILWHFATCGQHEGLLELARRLGEDRFRARAERIVVAHLRAAPPGRDSAAWTSRATCMLAIEVYVATLLTPDPGPRSQRPPRAHVEAVIS